ncbi:MAG TPA: arginine deiminase-related protein [Arenimonas sp.]|uniref:arginine deiminase-related protein n=1 Tax=Arenimonas sp. TaxID=1872635 RepID=UPI002C2575DC|nr:arginine deiminase-related protein [Arenimonas sp.]HMB58190.1 arginine deiminase-related protein [Arenimonas sp.]
MITRDFDAFLLQARATPADVGPACAKAAFIVAPEAFRLAEQSASDNRYMDLDIEVGADRALAQHRGLQLAMSQTLPTLCFPGHVDTPDALFPNNVFATVPGRLILGHMRHPVRQREVERADIRGFFTKVLGYEEVDLRTQSGVCELTGALVIDRARGLGFAGLSERCDEAGAAAMHAAFGLRATLMFDLAPGEYHTNVVLSVLAGRAVVLAPSGFADKAAAEAISALYAPHAVVLDAAQKNAFTGNCIALAEDQCWLSQVAEASLRSEQRAALREAGFELVAVELDEIEKAGGSLRCCVAEIF